MKRSERNNSKLYPGFSPHRNLRYQTKLFLSFLGVAVPVFVLILIFSAFFLQRSSSETIRQSQVSEMQQVADQLSYIFTDAENISEEIYYNESIQDMMLKSLHGEEYPSTVKVAYYINNFAANRDYAGSVVLTGTDSTLFSTERAYRNISSFANIRKKWWYPVMTSRRQPYGWFPAAQTDRKMQKSLTEEKIISDNSLVFTRPVYSMRDYKTLLGYMMIYIDPDYLQNIWKSCQWGETANLRLYAPTGKYTADTLSGGSDPLLVAGNRTAADYTKILKKHLFSGTSSAIIRDGMHRYVITSQNIRPVGWTLYMVTPLGEVSGFSSVIWMEILVLAAIFTVFLIFFRRFNLQNIARPITDLSAIMNDYRRIARTKSSDPAGMDQFAGSVSPESVRAYQARDDEIGEIYRAYDQLIGRLHTLIQENYIKNLEKKDAELALLQSQINPHFLYNTLDSINWLALVNGQNEISDMITALSDTFRLSLIKSSSQFIPLEHEIAYIRSYLTLQKLRYGDRLTVVFSTPQPLPELYIPRFILQPIVENSLKHGIDMTEEAQGTIRIEVETAEDLRISVTNDGNAIDLKQMKALLDFHPGKNELLVFQKKGYGVQNIHRRIRMICGEKYGLSYEKNDTQTICRILLPIKTEEPSSKIGGTA